MIFEIDLWITWRIVPRCEGSFYSRDILRWSSCPTLDSLWEIEQSQRCPMDWPADDILEEKWCRTTDFGWRNPSLVSVTKILSLSWRTSFDLFRSLTFLSCLIFFNSSWLGRFCERGMRFCRSRGPRRDSRGVDERLISMFCKERARA